MYIYTHSQFKTLEYCIYVYIMISKNSNVYNWKITEKVETFKMCCFFIIINLYVSMYIYMDRCKYDVTAWLENSCNTHIAQYLEK